jgi:pimeloyl-ACP methyl ester carboxylesterase
VERTVVEAPAPGGSLAVWLRGDGPRVLLLHGGPGLSGDYLDRLAEEELGEGWRIAGYQQRGLSPSTEEGPFTVAGHVADAVAVLDALGWERAWVIGHSWGGHLGLHMAVAVPHRLTGLLAIDPLGGVGDGGLERFEQTLQDRTPPDDRERARRLDERAMRGEGTEADALESLALYWPAYHARRDAVPPMPPMRSSVACYAATMASIHAELPGLEARLGGILMPVGMVAGAASPMPAEHAAGATARRIPGAWLEVVEGAGHFPWLERPGCVRAAARRLAAQA